MADDGLFEYNLLMLTVPAGGIDAGSPKRPSALLKKLAEVLVPVRFDPVSGARLREWINRHYTAAGVTVTPALCDLTSARCGESMFTLASEIDKVAYYVLADGRTEVTSDDIKLVACEGGGHDAFAFANAILDRRSADALAVLSEMKARRVEPVAVMAELTRVLCDMCAVDECLEAGMPAPAICSETGLRDYPVRLYSAAVRKLPRGALAAVLAAASEADAAVKSSAQDYLPIERLICTLCAAQCKISPGERPFTICEKRRNYAHGEKYPQVFISRFFHSPRPKTTVKSPVFSVSRAAKAEFSTLITVFNSLWKTLCERSVENTGVSVCTTEVNEID